MLTYIKIKGPKDLMDYNRIYTPRRYTNNTKRYSYNSIFLDKYK